MTKYAKWRLHKTIKFGALTQLTCFMFLLKIGVMHCSCRKCQKKIEVWRILSRVRTKNLLAETVLDKIFGTKYRIPVILDWKRKVWYPFLHDFWLLLPKPNFLKRDWVLGFVSTKKFEIFLIFPNFLRS